MVEEIVDQGAVNYIYRVRSSDLKNSIILKYGEEASKVGAMQNNVFYYTWGP